MLRASPHGFHFPDGLPSSHYFLARWLDALPVWLLA
jgi:hypothetical protein